mmetsp:Transcript_100179/g.279111  ORF Transcript_100179/g.279111 Transcript_100179/m.279111 type:complete len:360 (+) Transcript_100179:181-1260(+)
MCRLDLHRLLEHWGDLWNERDQLGLAMLLQEGGCQPVHREVRLDVLGDGFSVAPTVRGDLQTQGQLQDADAAKHLEEQHGQAPDVRGPARVLLLQHHLRRHEGQGAAGSPARVRHHGRQVKVRQLQPQARLVVSPVNDEGLGLEIAMANLGTQVNMRHRRDGLGNDGAHLGEEVDMLVCGLLAELQPTEERLVAPKLHEHEDVACRVEDLVEPCYPWMSPLVRRQLMHDLDGALQALQVHNVFDHLRFAHCLEHSLGIMRIVGGRRLGEQVLVSIGAVAALPAHGPAAQLLRDARGNRAVHARDHPVAEPDSEILPHGRLDPGPQLELALAHHLPPAQKIGQGVGHVARLGDHHTYLQR